MIELSLKTVIALMLGYFVIAYIIPAIFLSGIIFMTSVFGEHVFLIGLPLVLVVLFGMTLAIGEM